MAGFALKPWFWGLLALLAPCSYAMWQIDLGLQNPTSPNGIVSFELCAFSNSCAAILAAWGAEGRQLAMLSLGLDYLFMLLYPAFMGVCLLLAAQRQAGRLQAATHKVAWLLPEVALADAIETYALIQLVVQNAGTYYPWQAAVFASIKFALLGFCFVWLAATALYSAWRAGSA